MDVLDDRVAREEIFYRYQSSLSRPGIDFMPEPEGAVPADGFQH